MADRVTDTGTLQVPLGQVLADMQGTLTSMDRKVDTLGSRQDRTEVLLEQLTRTATDLREQQQKTADLDKRVALLESAKPLSVSQRVGLWVSIVSGLTGTIGLLALLVRLGG